MKLIEPPDWFQKAEFCGSYYSMEIPTEEQKRQLSLFPFIIWAYPFTLEESVREFQKKGIKVLVYISLYKAVSLKEASEVKETSEVRSSLKIYRGGPFYSECMKNPFWRATNLDNHPEWKLINEKGEFQKPFRNPNYLKGWYQVCRDVPGYKEAVLKGVKDLLDWGADGVFVDNVGCGNREVCYGEKKGFHKHLRNLQSWELELNILKEVYKLVKKYDKEKVVFTNGIHFDLLDCTDGGIIENYICSSLGNFSNNVGYLLQLGGIGESYMKHKKRAIGLPYIGTKGRTKIDDLFYSYSFAKLSQMGIWVHYDKDKHKILEDRRAEILFTLDLGEPLHRKERPDKIIGVQYKNGILYRVFKKGMVVVNPLSKKIRITIEIPKGVKCVENIFTGKKMKISKNKLSLTLSPISGRVYKFSYRG